MKIAVTGAAGTLGRAVVTDLRWAGADVRAIDVKPLPGFQGDGVVVDLKEQEAWTGLLDGCDAVVHLAAWPTPHATDPRRGWSDNVLLATNALFAATTAGVPRFIYASSQSVLGLAWSQRLVAPDYVPVDEDHPCRPSDWYSASKLAGETLVGAHARAGPLAAVALRFPVIWRHQDFAKCTARRRNQAEQGAKSQWAYIDARDAGAAVRLAVQAETSGFTVINATSPHVFAEEAPAALVRRWYPDLKDVRLSLDELTSIFDHRRAEAVIGFRARYRWRLNGITVSS